MATILTGVTMPLSRPISFGDVQLLRPAELTALSRAPKHPKADAAGAGEGVTAYAAENLMRNEQVRRAYTRDVKRLPPNAGDQRTSLKAQARRATPAPQRAWLAHTRPDLGPRPGSIGGAARSNAAASASAAKMARLGRASLVTSALLGGAEIALSDDKPRTSVQVAGGMGGGVAGGIAGAELGALVGSVVPGPGTVLGAVVGGIGGSLLGGHLGHEAGGAAVDSYRRGGGPRSAAPGVRPLTDRRR